MRGLKLVWDSVLHGADYAAADIRDKGNRGMSEHFGNGPDINAGAEAFNGEGVPGIMESLFNRGVGNRFSNLISFVFFIAVFAA